MSYKDITAGSKKGKVVAARFIESQTGTLGLEVACSFLEPSTQTQEKLNWVGWLSPKSIEFTMKTLVGSLGFTGDDEVVPGTSDLKPGVIDVNRELEFVIEIEEYEEKLRPRIRYINYGSNSAFKPLASNILKSRLAEVGFKAAFQMAKSQSTGEAAYAAPKAEAPNAPASHFSDEEVPF